MKKETAKSIKYIALRWNLWFLLSTSFFFAQNNWFCLFILAGRVDEACEPFIPQNTCLKLWWRRLQLHWRRIAIKTQFKFFDCGYEEKMLLVDSVAELSLWVWIASFNLTSLELIIQPPIIETSAGTFLISFPRIRCVRRFWSTRRGGFYLRFPAIKIAWTTR